MNSYGKSMFGGWYFESANGKEYYHEETKRALKATVKKNNFSLHRAKRVDHY